VSFREEDLTLAGKAERLVFHPKTIIILEKIIIAIDGHSSCGKSTLAKQLGDALGYTYISTGDMYRAVTLYFIENKVDIDNLEQVREALKHIHIEFKNDGSGTRIFLNGRDVQDEIRRMYVAEMVSYVAAIPEVRRAMVEQQRAIGKNKGVVMDGRDIGTVVFPDAELKIFLTADTDTRARRRFEELKAKGYEADFEEVKRNLTERDEIDSTRADSPLKKADDAIVIDNTNLDFDQQLKLALELVREKTGASHSTSH